MSVIRDTFTISNLSVLILIIMELSLWVYFWLRKIHVWYSLNPYYNGTISMSCFAKRRNKNSISLNPYYNGTISMRKQKPFSFPNTIVLILIIMELSLWDQTSANLKITGNFVLILIIMELSLWECLKIYYLLREPS